jgi:hypothetical protein
MIWAGVVEQRGLIFWLVRLVVDRRTRRGTGRDKCVNGVRPYVLDANVMN